jgi:hypothetical protein
LPDVLTVIDLLVAPFDHKYVPVADPDVKVTLLLQNVVGPDAVTVFVGAAFTVIGVADDVLEHPAAWLTVTLYEPEVLTLMD